MPPNLQEVKLKFARRRSAKVMGTLADREDEPQEGEEVEGIMVTNNFSSKIVSPDDLATYTPLRLGSISSKLHVPFCGAASTLELFLNEMYHGVNKYETEGIVASVTRFELQGGKVNTLGPIFVG
jgi:cleavage and polyadenylation specificity factor subunit 3